MADVGFLFPGQGSQYVGMGKELAEQFPVARQTFEEADEVLGFALSDLCFSGPEEALKLTENTQPAILTASIAALRVLESETALRPNFVAGHSLGEYSALVCAGDLTFRDAVRVVRERGRLMQAAVPAGKGAMAVVLGLEGNAVAALCEEASHGVSIKNNTITNCDYGQHSWPGLIYQTNTDNSTVENNLIDTVGDGGAFYNNETQTNEVHGIWFDAGAEGTNNNAVIRYNKVKNVSGIGIYYESAYDSTIHYNVVDTASVGIRHGGTWECRNLSIYNNTVYGTTTMGLYPNDLTATYTSTLKNNIITPASGYFIYVGSAMLGTLTVSNNLYDSNYGIATDSNWYYGGNKNYSQWVSASSETNSQFANPLFINPTGSDFRLQGASPAINAGTDVSLTED